MQGQRSGIGSLPETLGFDHGSTSNEPVIEPQICWNNMRNTSQNDTSITYMNSLNQEGPSLSGWNIGEPSSTGTQNQEQKIEHNWLSSMNNHCNGAGPIFEDRQYEMSNNLSLNNANNNINISDSVPHDLNMSSGFVGPIADATQEMDIPIPTPESVPDYLEENEGRRLSCKRKALEGQSSGSGSSSYFHHGEGSVWHPGYANHSGNSGISISEVNPRLGLGVGAESRPNLAAAQSVETSRRNLRLRINNASSNQQDSIIPTNNNAFLRLHSLNNLDLAAAATVPPPVVLPSVVAASDTTIPQGPRRNLQSSRWSRGSSSRSGGSSGGFLDSSANEEANSRTVPRNISEHPVFVPPAQSLVDWSFNNGGNLNGASNSRAGPSSGPHQQPPMAAGPNWVPHHRHTSHYPRRLRELVHRSLMASAASESGGQNGNFAALSSQDLPPSTGEQGRHAAHSRAAMLLDRQQLEGTFGIQHSMRGLIAAGEGRSRLVSEHIRNVLDIMRRGEGLRFEDVMILDQSMFFGMADIHDRHRDMRLDVDNMSYEELLALEERIGNVNTGLSEETISGRLKQSKYVCVSTALVDAEPCCICQEEYNNEDDIGKLDCGHDFHSECIKHWLLRKNLCPICKTTALIT